MKLSKDELKKLAYAKCKIYEIDPEKEAMSLTGRVYPIGEKYKLWEYQYRLLELALEKANEKN